MVVEKYMNFDRQDKVKGAPEGNHSPLPPLLSYKAEETEQRWEGAGNDEQLPPQSSLPPPVPAPRKEEATGAASVNATAVVSVAAEASAGGAAITATATASGHGPAVAVATAVVERFVSWTGSSGRNIVFFWDGMVWCFGRWGRAPRRGV